MQKQNTLSRWALWGVLVAAVLGSGAYYVIDRADKSRTTLPVYASVPAFEFMAHVGRPYGLDEMMGHVSVVDFFFTTCKAACPRMTSEMASIYRDFASRPDVRFVSISVDPNTDSLATLQAYAQANGINDERWMLLHGEAAEVQQLAEKGFMLSGGLDHSNKFVLVDQAGRIRSFYDSHAPEELEKLRMDIVSLLKTASD